MKKWFSMAIFKFRWKKMTKGQRATFIAGSFLMLVSAMLLCAVIAMPVEDIYGLNNYVGKYVFLLLSFLSFVWSTPFVSSTMHTEGRINQKYLKEINEIRVILGRKLWEDI